MGSQNILNYYGTKLDLVLDYSEYYDIELSTLQDEDLLNDSNDYLKVNETLEGLSTIKTTITLSEIDYTDDIENYSYSGFSFTINYQLLINKIGISNEFKILNNTIFILNFNNKKHYLSINGYNDSILIDIRLGNTQQDIIDKIDNDFYSCLEKVINEENCCNQALSLNVKPWTYQFMTDNCQITDIRRRNELGWSIDMVFNRENLNWADGSVFYFLGTADSTNNENHLDSTLSFSFTNDGRIKWNASRYSGYTSNNQYIETNYIETDQTPILCTTDSDKDFKITVVFERYRYINTNDLNKFGGWSKLRGWEVVPYEANEITAVTSTQISTFNCEKESPNINWEGSEFYRLGVLKIYLNGRPIYKKDNWEEVIPSNRGELPFIQSWGGMIHPISTYNGKCKFNIKQIKYYETPLDFIEVRNSFINEISEYDFSICETICNDDVIGYYPTKILTEDGELIFTENNDVIIF